MKNILYSRPPVGVVLTLFLFRVLVPGALGQEKVVQPFNGKTLEGWQAKPGGGQSAWCVGTATLDPADPGKFVVDPAGHQLINNTAGHGQSLDFYSEVQHGDALITLEVMVPKGSNSGIYVMGEYEVQVLDSFGNDNNPGPGDMGAIYGAQPPHNPRYKAPGEWNTYEIWWQAPKFSEQGEKTANARFLKVLLNGVTIHENVEMPGLTPGGVDGREKPKGPLMFQGNHGPVAYRNIKIAPLPQPVAYDVLDGYFVNNTFEPDQAESFVVLRDQAAFDQVFGVGAVMGDQAHRLPPENPFATRQVVAAIKRGKALWTYEVKSVTLASGVLTVDYTATAQPDEQAEFSCPLILSVPKGDYAAVRWIENGRVVREFGENE